MDPMQSHDMRVPKLKHRGRNRASFNASSERETESGITNLKVPASHKRAKSPGYNSNEADPNILAN